MSDSADESKRMSLVDFRITRKLKGDSSYANFNSASSAETELLLLGYGKTDSGTVYAIAGSS